MALRSTSLGDLERAVMDALWSHGPDLSVRDVMDRLTAAGSKELAYTTVMTVLDRLAKKGLVTQERQGRAFRYSPSRSREELAADMMLDVLGDTGSQSDRVAALQHFVGQISPAEAAAMRAVLEKQG